MASIEKIVPCVDMRDLAKPGTYDGYIQTEIYPEAKDMWEFFLVAHPEYTEIKPGECDIKYLMPTLKFEDALVSEDEGLRKQAEIIFARARQQNSIAHLAVSAYDAWRHKNSDTITTDYGAVHPDTDFAGMYAYEDWRRANLGFSALADITTASPSSAEEFREAA